MTAAQLAEPRPVNYLRPHQVEALVEDQDRLERAIATPGLVAQDDIPDLRRQLRNTNKMLDTQRPLAPHGSELDACVKQEAELREQITAGMPTQAEMRRNPPGAVSKHREWEYRNKAKIIEWKNTRLRLHAAGAVDENLPDSTEVANLERFRPRGGAQEMNLDAQGTQISGKMFYLPPAGAGLGTVFSQAEIERMGPAVVEMLALMSNDQRAALKAALAGDETAKRGK